ncbi:FlgN protein [Pseudosulfitobacter pseudonitzschiae]|uniref:Flagellar biosynthesis protein FlgN n=1 Tax=Pseudosulfitobacter pseudonitzschiae TaxID=1402135 RepID=A0A073JHG5_9RHOB|nr:flagellar biosynthesis protein FlgN [Pseudosulfitobacter pseudonitzschiae]KEJ97162.1 flagellar biosynthesis protein FlgN [Pseudosulfitobacter pseudonitzschiae]QKS10420.1 flagellar biosynthesis protein FlgN [Pseudosulfitobacter pseudonitzschiae]SHF52752.1 FlgN protein [Pseudosulfitobacter pseudonitzschiae]
MSNETVEDTVNALDDLLDQERGALLAGDLDRIARTLDLKQSLIDRLNELDVADRSSLAALNAKVMRNQSLLNSALDGIRAVTRRLATMRRIRSSLDIYDAQGKKNEIALTPNRSVEKRA